MRCPKKTILFLLLFFWLPTAATSQSAPQSTAVVHPLGADERYKADILLVVAHPDDEGIVTAYLARALDEGKRVAVAYGTRGGNGSNTAGMEHAAALADIREIEARRALATIGITHVWFLGGKDTASQNVLQSLASWGHGERLEEAVRLVRLTRPEVIITLLPSVTIGENHGDHQAAGVIATEAFELAGDPTVFPTQVAGASRRLEPYLENLRPWQPKKLYYAAIGDETKGKGPEYSVTGISKSRNLPFWRLTMQSFMSHETQAKAFIDSVAKMDEGQLQKMAAENNWWTSPRRFVLGKSLVGGSVTGDIFDGVSPGALEPSSRRVVPETPPENATPMKNTTAMKSPATSGASSGFAFQLAGPWRYYDQFRRRFGLEHLPQADPPEIAVQEKTTFYVPLYIRNNLASEQEITVSLEMPADWKLKSDTKYLLRAKEDAQIHLDIDLPAIASAEAAARDQHDIFVRAESAGDKVGELKMRVQLRKRALPQ